MFFQLHAASTESHPFLHQQDLLLREWEAGSYHKDGRHMGIKTFTNWLEELQIKLIDKDRN